MQQAGHAIADATLRDFQEIGGFPRGGRILVLVGKGHNGGDALIAAHAMLAAFPEAMAEVLFVFGERSLRPLAARAWRDLTHAAPDRIVAQPTFSAYDVCLDGIFGFQFRPPVDARVAGLIERVNVLSIRLRAAVDLPSADLFRADFTYATGCVKTPVLVGERAGRVRYLDLGFFKRPLDDTTADGSLDNDRVLTTAALDTLRALRPAQCDKRSFGHVFVLGGSRSFPGAILMSVEAALRSGAGLVTAFVPESLAASYAARLPEAMWVGWSETPAGGLALEGEHLLRERIERADALVVGPGLGRERETLALVASIVKTSPVPLVIDADALQADIVGEGDAPRVLTPHAGELKRIAGDRDLRAFAQQSRGTVVSKGPVTRLCNGGRIYHSFFGGPVLARGGSGDVLAGMIGTQLAQTPKDTLGAAARAVIWHGLAAEALAREHGQTAVRTTQLLDYLSAALRGS